VAASPTLNDSHVYRARDQGAPVEWLAIDLVPTAAGSTALSANAPHPHAAMLWIDFILGPEGQKLFADLYYGNPTKDYGFKRWQPEIGMSAADYDDKLRAWEKILREGANK
jgi:ABC-type Fe3+ transport system substrate-binding protein